jgi:hypothetical protein
VVSILQLVTGASLARLVGLGGPGAVVRLDDLDGGEWERGQRRRVSVAG